VERRNETERDGVKGQTHEEESGGTFGDTARD